MNWILENQPDAKPPFMYPLLGRIIDLGVLPIILFGGNEQYMAFS
jgi:hypothetical protein